MTKNLDNEGLKSIAGQYDLFFIDLWGVIHNGIELFQNSIDVLEEISTYWYLLFAAFIGGQIGNFLNLKIFPARILALVTATLVLFVALRMAIRLFWTSFLLN